MEPVHYGESVVKEDGTLVKVLSFDQELPRIKQVGRSLESIQGCVLKEDLNVYPELQKMVPIELSDLLCQRIKKLSKFGLVYIAKNLFVSADIPHSNVEPPDEVILDLCILVLDWPPTVITVVKDQVVSLDKAREYNLNLAKSVTATVRRFTKEQFSVVFGAVSESTFNTQEGFERCLNDLRDEKSRWCFPNSLAMPKKKCKNVIHGFLACVALTSSVVNDDDSDSMWFLTLDQFCILTENIDKQGVLVRTSGGGKVLIREVARRLERAGPTLLVMETMEQIRVARDQKTCSLMLTLDEWKDYLVKPYVGESVGAITNMVTNCQDCPDLPGLKGKYWLFIPDRGHTAVQPADTLQSDLSLKTDMSKEQLINIIQELQKTLESERQSKQREIDKMHADNGLLMQTQHELTQMLESVSVGGVSLDSGHGSDTSRRRRYVSGSVISIDSVEGTSGQGPAKRLLENIKKRLMLGRSKLRAVREVYVYMYKLSDEDKTSPHLLQCREQEMDKHRVNSGKCHINEDGELVNTPALHSRQDQSQGFTRCRATCSTSPVFLVSSSYGAHYWETETVVEVDGEGKWMKWPPMLEVGLVEEHQLDRDCWIHGRARSWCVRVGECERHRPGFCTQVWNQKEHVKCFPNAMSDFLGTSRTLMYGVVLDVCRNRLGFTDNDKGLVLHKMDVNFRETLYPVFGVFRDIPGLKKMSLISGNDITMTKEKERLILSCLS